MEHVRWTGQAQEVWCVEVGEGVLVLEDLLREHRREEDNCQIVLGDLVTEPHHRAPEGPIVLVGGDDADEILGEDVCVENDCARDRSRESRTQRRLADARCACDYQQGRSHERALSGTGRAAEHATNRRYEIGEAAGSAGFARERHSPILSPARPSASGWCLAAPNRMLPGMPEFEGAMASIT